MGTSAGSAWAKAVIAWNAATNEVRSGQVVAGQWSLSAEFDITYSFNPAGAWIANHQMTMNGKRCDFSIDDFKACAKMVSMKRGCAEKIVGEVRGTVSRRKTYADDAGIDRLQRDQIQVALRLESF